MRLLLCLAGLVVCGNAFARAFETKGPVVYTAPGGAKLRMTLYLPKDTGTVSRPAVLLIHGGAWFFGTRHQLHWYGRRLAENGYVAASITYRMMPKHGFPACLDDAKAGVRWLRAHAVEYGIDPDRIAVLGNSAGGHLAAMLGLTRPEDGLEGPDNPGSSSAVQAVIDYYGVADLSYYRNASGWIGMAGISAQFMRVFVGAKNRDDAAAYDRASPITYVRRGAPPFFLVHGTKDTFVPHGQSEALWEALRANGAPTRFVTVRHGHAFDFFHFKARERVFAEALDFLNEHLQATRGNRDGGV